MNPLSQQFEASVAAFPQALALIEDQRSVTYTQLAARVDQLVHALQQAGLREQMRVALDGVNSIEFVAAYLAVARLGACAVPLDSRLAAAEVSAQLADCQPNAYVMSGAATPLAAWVAEALPGALSVALPGPAGETSQLLLDPSQAGVQAAQAGDLVIHYSSGSTGQSKGIVLSADNIYHKVNNWNATLEITPRDVFLCTVTLSHCYGMYVHTLAGLLAGARIYLPDLASLTPGRIARMISEQGITVFGSLPYMYQLLLALPPERLQLSHIRYLISGSAPLPEVVAHAFHQRFGRHLNQVYGLTEVGLITFNTHPVDPMSLGGLTANMQARVLNEQGEVCAVGELGELVVRCESMSRGYLANPEDQKLMFRDGWLYTKDIVRQLEDGSFRMCGRISQFINVGGNKVSPVEVENALLSHPAVKEAAVVGRRHEVTTEEVVAFVVLQPEAQAAGSVTPRELAAHCKAQLSAYKQPREIRWVAELPKSPLGKVLKSQLFDLPAQPAPAGAAAV